MKNAGLLLLQKSREAYARKLQKILLFTSCLTVLILSSYQSKATQVTGTLTVDPSGTASATVFKDLNSVINYITSATTRPDGGPANAAPFGVSGPLIININAGTYYEQVDIPAITGASASNTITLKGAGTVNTIVSCTTATTSLRHTIRLNSTSWVIVRDMTIRGTSASGFAWPVHFMGSTNNSRLAGCTVDFGITALSTQISDNYTAVVMNNNVSTLSAAGTFNNIDIDSNYILGGHNSVYAAGTSASSIMIRVRKNTSDSSNRYGMYFTGIGELKCLNNIIQNRISSTSVTDGTGIYVLSCNVQAGRNHEIRNNKVMNAESYGIHLQSNTLVSSPRSAVTNNAVGGSFRNNNATGIFLNTYPSSMISTWDVFFNSVNIGYATSGSTAAAICVQTCCSQEIDIRNNNLLISNASSSAVPLRTLTWAFGNSTLTLNSNNYYKRGQGAATVLIDNVGTVYTVSTFVNGGGYNSSSISKDPLYLSLTNLYPGTPCNNGVLISGYTTDINGATRAAAPDMGAYEYTASANDAGITAIVAPSIPMTPGTQNVTLTLTNLGSSALTSATVGYQLNGGSVVTQNWTGNLAACASTNVVFNGAQAITIAAGNSYTLKGFSSDPNASVDGNSNNDSIFSTTFGSSLSGNYTIDPAGSGPSNFTSFGAATAALSNGGISGPVVFNVASGTYAEQVIISQVSGSSAANTITFNGGTGNAATRIISFAGTASAPHTLKLDNASYINIFNLTILGTGTTNGWPLHLMNTNFVTARNCSISFTGTGLTSSSQNFIPVVANGSSSSPSFSGTVTNLVIENNTISGGYAGIYVYGSTSATGSANHYLNGNNISNCSSYGIYDYYTYTDQEMKNNTISMRVGNANGYGVYIVASQSPAASFEYTGNVIKDAGQYGIYLSNLAGSAAFPAFIANNMIGGGFVSASSYGIYLNSCSYTNVWHNSVNLDAANMGTTLAALYLGSTNNADIRNNNLAVTGTNSLALPLITASSSFIALDYNNYYRFTNPVQLININGAIYSSTNLFGAGGFNTNSRVTNPMYTNAKDLHTGLKCNTGISISGYAVDVDGNTRSNPPGIGADENTNSNTLDLAVESISSPSVPVASGSQNITVLIRNNGSSTITSANVSYKVNNGTAVTQAWTGSLAPCATAVVTFTGASQFNFLPSTAYTLLVYSDQPNAGADNAMVNDTARLTVVATGISGNFTIDGSIPASATNFQTFATAITAMTNNGIAGPVNFTVAPATYAVQVVIPAIPGASSTNTVTFDGGANASTVILSFASSTSGARHTLRFDATNWIRIRNMSIIGSGTFAWPIHINTGSSNLQIRNCLISCTQTLTNQTSTNYAGIVISSSTSSLSGGNFSSNIDIDSNTITNGWYGISFYGSGNTGFNPAINIRKNKIDSSGLYGINLSYAMGSVLNDNTINMRMSNGASTGSYGMYVLNCYTTGTENIQVNRNKITGCTQYGIYLQTTGGVSASTQRAQLINNAIGGGFTSASVSGIYFASANYWDVWFNSVNLDNAATGTAQCIYLTTGSPTFNDIRNNNFAVTNASASGALPYRSVGSATVNALNYNNYYKAGATASTNIISVLGTNYTPSTFTGANGGGANSIAQNPSFTSSTNLLPTVNTNKGTTLVSVPTDIAGTYRNIPPDLGSYEIPSTALTDLAIVKLNSPDTTLPVGSYNVSVTVRNFGSSPITSFNLRHTVNGINMQDTAITGISLAQNAAMDINMGAGKQVTFGPTANTLKVYLYQPNGSNDGLQTNDSIVIGPRFPSMNGTYTINPAGSGPSNFISFATAATAINSGGVSGPVIFNVASGTFTEQITLNALNGASATNTVRFVGNGTTNTILNFAGAAAPNQHTVRLNGSSWISFENMTISGGGTTSNWVVHLLNASNCTVKKCKISVPASVTSSSFINILANNVSTSGGETTTSTVINNNVIDSNTIENGYYGIMLSNNNGANINYMRGNTINNCYYNALYLYFYQAFKFNGNTVNMRPGISNSYGINSFVSTANSPLYSEIRNNVITNAGSYGIYLTSANGSSGGTPYGEIVNNMIGGGFFNTGGAGIYLSSCSYWKIWHNTINYDAIGNSAALNLQNGSLNDVRNNIFAIRNASATLATPVILSTSTAASVFNYNNLYNAATTNLLNIGGNIYTTGNYTVAFPNGAGINSKNLNPNFTSATNLHIGEACMNGDNLGITADIDGNARGTTPDMGADEMTTVPALDASVAKINSPSFPFAAGTQPVNITIQNNGNTTLTGLTLAYSVNGSAPVTQSWSGSLASCDTLNFTFSATYNFSSGPNVVKVYVASPNGGADANTINDTVTSVPLCTGLSGTYTINPAGAGATNFTSFSAALSALNCGGLAGAVVFNVANGVYNEQVNLGSVQGASATNTITIQSASGNASAVTISYVPGVENYVMNLNSTDYLTVKNITLMNASTGGSYFNVLQIGNSANNNTFRACVFTNALPTNGSLVYSNNTTDNNNTFVSNTFNGGSYGIQWQSNTSAVAAYALNLVIDSNTFNNQYNYGVYVYYCNATRIRNNTVTSSSTTTYYGIYATYIYQNAQVLNNNIVINTSASQAYGLGLIGLNNGGNASVRALIANNMIKVSTGTANNFGIYIDQYMYYSDVIHNTVNVINSGTGIAYAISMNTSFSGYTTDNCNFVNNIFQALSSSTGSSAFYHNSSSALNNVTINYNNYFVTTGNIARFQNTTLATLANWKSTYATYNVNSLSKRASFTGANDLHNTTPCLDNVGSNAYLALVDKDIDGQGRNATTPDMGADEFTAQPYDIRVSRISAPAGYSASAQTVKAWIVNGGTTTVTSANIAYNINGGAAVSQNFTGLSVLACDSVEVTFTTPVSTPTGYSVLQAFVSGIINGSNPDGNNLNDTTGFAFCTSLAGNFTINSALSLSSTNFQSIGGAVNAMKSCGLTGA
ncbi:MAG: right-handed parallel beta-helix repeat-containing protein, partial [Bacteroidota bacterium]